jgi:GNAT superfamily N-acetyltransferase
MRDEGERGASIDALVVQRSQWRRGAGRALVEAVESWADDAGASLIKLTTYANSPVSVPFYTALGYDNRAIVFLKYLGEEPPST